MEYVICIFMLCGDNFIFHLLNSSQKHILTRDALTLAGPWMHK